MQENELRPHLERALNVVKATDPAATRALEHVLKHGDRYFLFFNEDKLPKVLALARDVALRHAEDSAKGLGGMMSTADGGILARAVLRLAKQAEVLAAQIAAMQNHIAGLEDHAARLEEGIGGAVTGDPASEPRG